MSLNVRTLRSALRAAIGSLHTSAGRTSGEVTTFYVSSVHAGAGTGTSKGHSPDEPLTTLDEAIGRCTANSGHTIIVGESHAETLAGAAAVDVDVAGIAIIGRGTGANRPTFTLSAVASTFAVNAASVVLRNCILTVSADATVVLDLNSTDGLVEDVDILASGTKEFVTGIDINGGAANACDRTTLRRVRIFSTANAGADRGIELGEVADRVVIEDCVVHGDWADAGLHNPTGKILTNLHIKGGSYHNLQTGDHAIELVSACTGAAEKVSMYADAQGTTFDPGSLKCVDSQMVNAIDSMSIASPVAVSTADTVEAAIFGANGVTTWPSSAAPANGVNVAEVLGWMNDALQAGPGVVTWESGAAPANGVSIAGGLRFVSEAITDGAAFSQTVDPGGTARASIELVLADLGAMLAGTAGITTFPAAQIPANGVAIAEALREVHDQADKAVTSSAAVLTNAGTVFTIAGGPIEILSLVAVCVTTNDGTAATLQWSADPTDGVAVTITAASASLASVAAGGMVVCQGTTLATAPLVSASGANIAMAVTNGIVVGAGVITTVIGSGPSTGTWRHHLRYRPLARGVTVTGT